MGAAGALPFIGMGMNFVGTYEEGQQDANMGQYAQTTYLAEAKATKQAGEYESLQQRKTAERAQGAEVAQTYAQGGTLTGSKLIIAADNAKNMESDARMIMRNAQLKAKGLQLQGDFMKWKGIQAQTAAIWRGYTDLVTDSYSMGLVPHKQPGTIETGAGLPGPGGGGGDGGFMGNAGATNIYGFGGV